MDLRCLPSILLLQLTIVLPSVCLTAVTPDTQQGALYGTCSHIKLTGKTSRWTCEFQCNNSCINVKKNRRVNRLKWTFKKMPTEEKFCLTEKFGNRGKEETHCACFLNNPSAPCNTAAFNSVSTTRSSSEKPPTSAPRSYTTKFGTKKVGKIAASRRDRRNCNQYILLAGIFGSLTVFLLVAFLTTLILLCRQRSRDRETVKEQEQVNGHINKPVDTGPDCAETGSSQNTDINTTTDKGTRVSSVYETNVTTDHYYEDLQQLGAHADNNGSKLPSAYEQLEDRYGYVLADSKMDDGDVVVPATDSPDHMTDISDDGTEMVQNIIYQTGTVDDETETAQNAPEG